MNSNNNKRERRNRTEDEILNNPRIKEILSIFAKSKTAILTPNLIYKEMSSLRQSKNQLDRDLTALVIIERLEWMERGKYRLSNKFMRDIYRAELMTYLDKLPKHVIFEDRVALFGFDLSYLQKEDVFEHYNLSNQYKEYIYLCQDIAQRTELLFVQIELAYFIDNFEHELSKLKSMQKKAILYKDANNLINIWLTNKGINPDNPGTFLNPYMESIRKPRVPDLDSILSTEILKPDTLTGMLDKNGKKVFETLSHKQWKSNCTYEETFNSLLETGEFDLSKRGIERIYKKLRQIDEEMYCLWRKPFYLPTFNPLIVIGKEIRAFNPTSENKMSEPEPKNKQI